MTRVQWFLVILVAILLGVLWYFLIYSPTAEEIEDTRAETDRVLQQAAQERQRADELRAIRQDAPEAEAQLAFGRSVIPEDAAIPALFRQLQQAADDAGVRLPALSPSAPTTVTVDGTEITQIGVSMTIEGSYFQVVDFARRVEDPLLTPRALRWDAASLGPTDFPQLTVSLSGQVFSRGVTDIPIQEPPPVEEEEPDDDADELDELDDLEGGGQ